MVQMAKNLLHSFYYILYQPKGVPSSHCNFSGSGGTKMAAISILVNAVICQSQIGWYCLWGRNILMARPSTFLESRSWWGYDCIYYPLKLNDLGILEMLMGSLEHWKPFLSSFYEGFFFFTTLDSIIVGTSLGSTTFNNMKPSPWWQDAGC